jgi:hypothetical protein
LDSLPFSDPYQNVTDPTTAKTCGLLLTYLSSVSSVVDLDPEPAGQIHIILPDLDPDNHPGHSNPDPAYSDRYPINSKHMYFFIFSRKFVKNT